MNSHILPVDHFLCITTFLFHFTFSTEFLTELELRLGLMLCMISVECEWKEMTLIMFIFIPFRLLKCLTGLCNKFFNYNHHHLAQKGNHIYYNPQPN